MGARQSPRRQGDRGRLRRDFPHLMQKQLSEITRWDIDGWRSRAAKAGQKPATINRTLNVLQRLYIGVEFVRDRKSKKLDRQAATRIVDMLRDRNVLVGIAGPYGNVLKIRPPLPFGREHADMLVKALSNRSRLYPNLRSAR